MQFQQRMPPPAKDAETPSANSLFSLSERPAQQAHSIRSGDLRWRAREMARNVAVQIRGAKVCPVGGVAAFRRGKEWCIWKETSRIRVCRWFRVRPRINAPCLLDQHQTKDRNLRLALRPGSGRMDMRLPQPGQGQHQNQERDKKAHVSRASHRCLNLCVISKACPSDFTTQHGNLRMPRYPWPHGV